jgi:hypothetical protein
MLEGVGLKDALDALLQDVTGPPGTNFAWVRRRVSPDSLQLTVRQRDKDGRMIHDLHFERPCKSGPRIKTAFSQPQLDGVLNEAALRAGVEVRRSIGSRARLPTRAASECAQSCMGSSKTTTP